MARIHIYCMIMAIFYLASLSRSNDDKFFRCEAIVKKFSDSSSKIGLQEDRLSIKDILFFLHVPRTGGRTYFHCFLRKLYKSSLHCPPSYVKLQFDPRKPNCRLMSTHDDYSMMLELPADMTSVMTILRNPIDRVFSSYEFSVNVASRFLNSSHLTSALASFNHLRSLNRSQSSTLEIWPWKHLVPWMLYDLFERKEAREAKKVVNTKDYVNSYDIEEMVMPLHVYIEDPIVQDNVHNGATFQVAGLTNNSHLSESHEIRHCVIEFPELGGVALDVAKSRLDQMLFVGLTEKHKKTANMFLDLVGSQVLSQLESWRPEAIQSTLHPQETNIFFPYPELEKSNGAEDVTGHKGTREDNSVITAHTSNENMTVESLIKTYEKCAEGLRRFDLILRNRSLKKVSPVNFTKEARSMVPEHVIQRILALNSLDYELYKHAQEIFLRQEKFLKLRSSTYNLKEKTSSVDEKLAITWNKHWTEAVIVFLSILIVVIVVAMTVRRRTLKVKV